MRKISIIAVILLLLTSSALPVCQIPRPRLVCAEYFQRKLVVIAKLVKIRHLVPEHDQDGYLYTMALNRTLRGSVGPTFLIYEENSSGRATFGWKRGEDYLLFLSFSKPDQAWVLDGCGNSGPLSKASAALRTIERIGTERNGGVIQGAVSSERQDIPVSDMRISIRGNERTYRLFTKKNGEFKINVPPGTYVAKAMRKGWSCEPEMLTYEKPERITIENGSCAQVQFTCIQGERVQSH